MSDPKYSGYEVLYVPAGSILSAAEYRFIERPCRLVDPDGVVFELDGSLSKDQELP